MTHNDERPVHSRLPEDDERDYLRKVKRLLDDRDSNAWPAVYTIKANEYPLFLISWTTAIQKPITHASSDLQVSKIHGYAASSFMLT